MSTLDPDDDDDCPWEIPLKSATPTTTPPIPSKKKSEERKFVSNYSSSHLSASDRSWPVLIGTPKQIGWALSIRARVINYIHDSKNYYSDFEIQKAFGEIRKMTKAKDWIEKAQNIGYFVAKLVNGEK